MYGKHRAFSAHRVECADNAANHFVKKATASYIYADTSTVLLEDNRFNFFYRIWIGIFCRHSGESGEIMPPNKMLTGCFHGRKIQGIVSTSPNRIRIKGVGTSSVEGVAVAFFASRVSGGSCQIRNGCFQCECLYREWSGGRESVFRYPCDQSASKWKHCPSAWTPASVRLHP